MKKNRIWELDMTRGFAIIMVLVDHTLFDFAYLFSSWRHCGNAFLESLYTAGKTYMASNARYFWRPSFLFLFFCVSGICTALSRNNLIRGVKLFCVSALLSVATYAAEYFTGTSCFILMGVLHCMSFVILAYALAESAMKGIFALTEKLSRKTLSPSLRRWVSAGLLLVCTVVFFVIDAKYNVTFAEAFGKGSTIAYDNDWRGFFFFESSWWTGDYFPLFPFIAFFFFGAFLSKCLYNKKRTLFPVLDGKWHYFFTYPGRYSLWIYLVGQVAVIGLSAVLSYLILGGV